MTVVETFSVMISALMVFTMTASVGINDLLINDLFLLNIVHFKLYSMIEVLEYFSVFICDCDSHDICSFFNDSMVDLN